MLEVVIFVNFFIVCCYTAKKMELVNTIYGSIQLSLVAAFTYFLMFLRGVNKMVDVVTNRMFDTFNKFSPRDTQNESLTTLTTLKRYSAEQRQKKSLIRDAEIKAKESKLFDIKENAPQVTLPTSRPLMGLSCYSCTPSSKNSLVNKTTKHLALKNILNYQMPKAKSGILYRTFSHFFQVYELKKFDYPQVAHKVLKDPRLKHAIEKTAIQQFQDSDQSDDEFYQRLLRNNEKRARRLLKDMRSTLSDFLLRFTSWVLYKLLPMFLSSVVVHPGQVEMLKEAGNSRLPLIFLPLHRSHLDYILMSFILLNNNIRSPLVAAGDNLRIPFFGSLLRGLGAFFIKRRIDPIMGRKDHVYKTVLHTYMNECLRAGHNIEFFLEGGRTRTGKPCMPKYGILSVIVDAFIDGTIEDALLVPVSINYEKLVDGNFIREQLGQPKEMETFGAAMKGIWHVLNSNYGMMRIDFNQPFSMKELVKTFNTNVKVQSNGAKKLLKSNPSTTSLYGTDVVSDEHKSLVESISKHVLYDCAKSTSVMSTNAVAFLLLNRFRNGVTIEHLIAALDELRAELFNAGRDIGFSGDSLDVINYAVDMLGPSLVTKIRVNNEEVIKPKAVLPNVIELSYYSNTLITYYALESIVAIAITMLTDKASIVKQQELTETIINLCSMFQYEFILFKPCQILENAIHDCIEDLNRRKEILVTKNNNSVEVLRNKRLAQQLVDEENNDDDLVYEINTKSAVVVEHLNYLRGLLLPLIEAYSVTALCLKKLIGKTMLENELVKEVLEEIKKQLAAGTLTYEESVSVDSVKNALKLFQKWEILECHTENKMRLYYLKELEDNSDSVDLLYNRINKYRSSFSDEF